MKKKKRGAPRGNKNALKIGADDLLRVRVPGEKKRRYEANAEAHGLTLSGWVVAACDSALGQPPTSVA